MSNVSFQADTRNNGVVLVSFTIDAGNIDEPIDAVFPMFRRGIRYYIISCFKKSKWKCRKLTITRLFLYQSKL